MTKYEVFNYYLSIKTHLFTKKYDMIKYNYKSHINYNSFEKRNDKYIFNNKYLKNLQKKDLIKFFIATFLEIGNKHITEIIEIINNESFYYLIDFNDKLNNFKDHLLKDFDVINKYKQTKRLNLNEKENPPLFNLFLYNYKIGRAHV